MAALRKAAELGCTASQNELGALLLSHNKAIEAMEWFSQSAAKGNMYAQANIGWGYYSGNGVTQSYPLALSWYKKAAEQGHPESQYNLGLMYADALGTSKNLEAAEHWLVLASNGGVASASEALARVRRKT
ncbi:MAG: sel1 repeat family protein [Candidatus Competibacteraceae bacterium]|nr:MAG: sel1 repeat family protein [Candidatus Competibacteraceae bacterium]